MSIDFGGQKNTDGLLFPAKTEEVPRPTLPSGTEELMTLYVTTTGFGEFTLSAEFRPSTDPALGTKTIDWTAIGALSSSALP